MPVKPIPDGYGTVTPMVLVDNPGKFLEFARRAFTAVEIMQLRAPDGSVAHAEINIGNSRIMVERSGGPSSAVSLYLYVTNCDELYQSALAAGAAVGQQLGDKVWGDRVGMVKDPFGNSWWIATHTEDVSPEEISRRVAAMNR